MEFLSISSIKKLHSSSIRLPRSKSESNRMLIIQALSHHPLHLEALSNARDTQIMQGLLDQPAESIWNVQDAGTVCRFMTAYAGLQGHSHEIIGTARMEKRPLKPLVEALRQIGFDIRYLKNEGYPPVAIQPLAEQKAKEVSIPGNISSQFISALLMIAPCLPQGLAIELIPPVTSRPYLEMTLGLMKKAGIEFKAFENSLLIAPQAYQSLHYTIEADWSAASYWYSLVALAQDPDLRITLPGLRKTSFQGDQKIVEYMRHFNVHTTWEKEGVLLQYQQKSYTPIPKLNFTDTPDLAQTVMVTAAGLGLSLEAIGLESLHIKETDRLKALQQELKKLDVDFQEVNYGHWKLDASAITFPEELLVNTYEDHRMAMAFAPLLTKTALKIEHPGVVAKSYPDFWDELEKVKG